MTTLLVTGGAGFIGSNFINYMLSKHKNYTVINFDKLTYAGNLENLKHVKSNKNYCFIKGDICEKEALEEVFRENNIDLVVNFAAESHVDRSILEPETFIKTNVLGAVNLLNAAKESWKYKGGFKEGKKFLQISTDEVYGSLGSTGRFTEASPLDPHSPYSASKAGADMVAKSYYDTYGFPVNITRCSNNYGPYQFPEKLIPLMINNALNHKQLPVYGDGLNVRDWIYVKDHCAALDKVLSMGKPGEIYNIGGNSERTNIEVVKTIVGYLNQNVDSSITEDLITYVGDRKGHDRRYAIDASKIGKELGWHPETSFEYGLTKTIRWYLDNREWLDNVTSGEYQSYYRKVYEEEQGE